MEKITVTLPLPDKRIHAHNTGHWRAKAGPIKAYRQLAATSASQTIPPMWERARLTIRFFWRDRRRRDGLNAAQSCKAAIDGCVDAGIVVDDCWSVIPQCVVTSDVDKKNPRVELEFERI